MDGLNVIDSRSVQSRGGGEPGVGAQFRLAAIDIDDTLLGPDAQISEANAEAVADLRRQGVRVVLASGRSHANMLPYHHALRLGAGPVISAQGALVRGALTGSTWYELVTPPESVAEVTAAGIAHGYTVQHYRRDGIYFQGRSAWSDYDQSRNEQAQIEVGSLATSGWDGVLKVIWLGDPAGIAAIATDARQRFAARVTVTETDPGYLEFGPPGASKAKGLAEVGERLGIPREQIVAFGDGNNDVPMLRWAGLGVAMPHGREAARAAADRVGPEGDEDGALARAIAMVFAGTDAFIGEDPIDPALTEVG